MEMDKASSLEELVVKLGRQSQLEKYWKMCAKLWEHKGQVITYPGEYGTPSQQKGYLLWVLKDE